jgi:vacuolar-type H+-ATPase subunit F/Vma7
VSVVVAIGETHDLQGFALVGVSVISATTEAEVEEAWNHLPADTSLAILSTAAAATLDLQLDGRPDVLTVVMP